MRFEVILRNENYGNGVTVSSHRGSSPNHGIPRIIEADRYEVSCEGGYLRINFYSGNNELVSTLFDLPSEINALPDVEA